jgi:hypothetical protein
MGNRMVNHCAFFVGTLIIENQVIATPGKRKKPKNLLQAEIISAYSFGPVV